MNLSAALLILANLVPLAGVVFWGWDTVLVLALFWIENLIIGAFNLLRMAWSSVIHKRKEGLFLMFFFIVHYGAFCSIHGQLLADLLDQSVSVNGLLGFQPTGLAALYLDAVAVLLHFIQTLAPVIWLGLTGLFLSRAVSFIENFILAGEVFSAPPNQLMLQPYQQIVVMHVGLVLGAIVLQELGSPTWLLAIIVLLKIIFDYRQFRQRRRKELVEQIKDI